MERRNLSLTPRNEDTREQRAVALPQHFSLTEIKQHFDDGMRFVREQFSVANSLSESDNIEGCKLILRSQVAFSEGLLDFFIHEISKYCLFKMFTGSWEKSEKYKNLQIKMSHVERGLASVESHEWFFSYLNEHFSCDVFLSGESIKDQLNLIGIQFGVAMHKAFQERTENESHKVAKRTLDELYKRRNQIVHQADRVHATAEQVDITHEYVEEYLDKIEKIVTAIYQVALEKDSQT